MSAQEEWRTVEGFPDYRVSDLGRVMSLKGKQPKILQPYLNGRGDYPYPSVTLRQDGRKQIRTVHSLVAEAFIGPRPDGLEVRHLNGDPMDSRASNLSFGSHADNMQDRLAHGRHPMANKTHCKRDHEFTDDNTLVYRGSRFCRACKRVREMGYMFRAASVPTASAA
jgi:hypothetical protein